MSPDEDRRFDIREAPPGLGSRADTPETGDDRRCRGRSSEDLSCAGCRRLVLPARRQHRQSSTYARGRRRIRISHGERRRRHPAFPHLCAGSVIGEWKRHRPSMMKGTGSCPVSITVRAGCVQNRFGEIQNERLGRTSSDGHQPVVTTITVRTLLPPHHRAACRTERVRPTATSQCREPARCEAHQKARANSTEIANAPSHVTIKESMISRGRSRQHSA